MRIGLVVYGLDRQAAGIGRYTCQLTTALAGQGLAVHRLWAGQRPPAAAGDSLRGAYLLPGLLTVGQVEVARLSRRLNLDVVHDPTGAMPLFLTGSARVVTIHDAVPYVCPQTSSHLDWLVYRFWLPLAVRRANAVITVSEHSRRDVLKHLPVSQSCLTVVSEAADRRFRPMEPAALGPILREYGVAGPYILYVGSLTARKNLPRLLEAYGRQRQWSGRWKLVVVGVRKWKSSPIFDSVERLGLGSHVHFTGYVADQHLPALYNGADLFVFPSLYEGFGLPVVEAMACGTPVVTSNTSALPEVVGDAALLIDPYNVDEIAAAMRRVLEDGNLARDLRKRALARAAQFSWERAARETIDVYEKVLEQRGP